MIGSADNLMNEMDDMESSSRRMEAKRKGEKAEGRKPKRRKFPRLEGC